ncbi:hypothetical protein [Glycomyces xiaoerkulensis]|uniref:hypothetical protein n=1 Tax=Glycomyces xiaoerkulensis TaxID=2038139 RepID=UPI0012FFE110|nr:hypothetical protein [Glycomyces xiaoerkulensis]
MIGAILRTAVRGLVMAVVLLLGAGCFANSTPYLESVDSKVPRSQIIGSWVNSAGEEFEFFEDGTLEYSSVSRVPWHGGLDSGSYPVSLDGTWRMCSHDITSGELEGGDRCGESEKSAMWISVSINEIDGSSVWRELVFTGEVEDPRFYIYDVDLSIRDEGIFSKE